MAEIVGAIGTSHSPLLLASPDLWLERAVHDETNTELYDHTGQARTFDELLEIADGRYEQEIDPDCWEVRYKLCQQALDRLGSDVSELASDVYLIVGDDQSELFHPGNQPAIAMFWGDTWRTGILPFPSTPFWDVVKPGYAMDDHHHLDGAPALALDLIGHLVDAGFDLTTVNRTPDERGFGHAYGFVVRRIIDGAPVIPLMLNTYYAPNQPTPSRCYDLGKAIAGAVAAASSDARVTLVASGGLSHFVVNEKFDAEVLDALANGDETVLRTLPVELLNGGSSEIRNWVTVAGAMEGRPLSWREYVPCYRTAAGTGCGMAFARWD
jgi:3-O-methylgallate 3,4-dioxygenase